MLNDVQKHILEVVAAMKNGEADGAVNIRVDGKKAHRVNAEHIRIESKPIKTASTFTLPPLPSTKASIFPWC